jgi:hypothetical protein
LNKRFLSLGLFAAACAGLSYGQIATCAADTVATGGQISSAANPGPRSLRAEGTTELVADFQFNCTSAAAGTGTLSAFLSVAVTSRVNANNGATPFTEATLFICTTAVLCNSVAAPVPAAGTVSATYGVVSGQQIRFSGITFPAGTFFGRVSNVRVNANAAPAASPLATVTAQILASQNGTSALTAPAATVGYVAQSLAAPTLLSGSAQSYDTCAGNPLPAKGNLTSISFAVTLGETFAGAFKALEAGSYIASDGSGAGAATSGTQLQLAFSGVPNGVTIYLPSSISNGSLTLALAGGTSGATGAPPAFNVPGGAAPALPATFPAGETVSASAGLVAAGGTVTAVYLVIATDDSISNENAVVPAWVVFAPGAVTTAQGAITVTVGYSPQLAQISSTPVPNFAPVTTGGLSTSVIIPCQTNLLFPFVTNQLGFDTGLALSNTSTDPFGTVSRPGSCTLNFYGTGPPTPSTGVPAPGGTQFGGVVSSFLLSDVAPGFSGYIIAVCSYNFGHGFAYIASNLSQNSGTAMGYVAPVLPNRAAQVFGESLGQ